MRQRIEPPFTPDRVFEELPVPFVFHWERGKDSPEFGVLDTERLSRAVAQGLCVVCGRPILSDVRAWFGVVGAEVSDFWFRYPPMHTSCAEYAARYCPFLLSDQEGQHASDAEEYAVYLGSGVERKRTLTRPKRLLRMVTVPEFIESTPSVTRILVVGPSNLGWQALSTLLKDALGIQVVGEAEDVVSALPVISEVSPDVIICGARPPDYEPLRLASTIRNELGLSIPVIVIAQRSYPSVILEFFRSNLKGYLHLDETNLESLSHAIRAAGHGLTVMSGEVRQVLNQGYANLHPTAIRRDLFESLSQRERDVLQHMIEGLTNKEIASRLGISVRTVETHVLQILNKLEVRSRTEAVTKTLRLAASHASQ